MIENASTLLCIEIVFQFYKQYKNREETGTHKRYETFFFLLQNRFSLLCNFQILNTRCFFIIIHFYMTYIIIIIRKKRSALT